MISIACYNLQKSLIENEKTPLNLRKKWFTDRSQNGTGSVLTARFVQWLQENNDLSYEHQRHA